MVNIKVTTTTSERHFLHMSLKATMLHEESHNHWPFYVFWFPPLLAQLGLFVMGFQIATPSAEVSGSVQAGSSALSTPEIQLKSIC